jgi:hypothetical protein
VASYRSSTGTWYILQSRTNTVTTYLWGLSNDTPVPGDYDGDGRTDIAVFRLSNGVRYILKSSMNYSSSMAYPWGAFGDIP